MKKEIKFEYHDNSYNLTFNREGDMLTVINGEEEFSVKLVEGATLARPRPKAMAANTAEKEADKIEATPMAGRDGAEKASITGMIKEIIVRKGSSVGSGDLLLIMEAMKMDIEVFAGKSGIVDDIFVTPGMNVSAGQALVGIA